MTDISKTADKVLAALQSLGEGHPMTPTQMALRLGESRTVAQRVLTTLLDSGLVVRSGGSYALSSQVRQLADMVQPRLRSVVSQETVSLSHSLRETVIFQIPDGGYAVVLEQHLASEKATLQVRHDIGSRSPLTETASGLAILAARAPASARAVSQDARHPSVAAALQKTRDAGFAVTSEGLQAGVSGMAIGVRHHGAVMGSLAVLVPSFREVDLAGYREPLAQAARRIEKALDG